MKIRNVSIDHGYAITRGWVGSRGAYSSGLALVTDTQVTAGPVDAIQLEGASVRDLGDGRVLVQIFGNEISPTALSSNTNDWSPVDATDGTLGVDTASVIRLDSGAAHDLTGIVAPGAGNTHWLELANISAYTVTLKHDATSTAANRFLCPSDVDLSLAKDSAVLLWYDDTSTRWRVVGGTGGSFATPAIVLGTAAGAGSATTVIRSDATIIAFDTTAPVNQAIADSAATGLQAVAARRDHKHGMPSAATPSGGYGTAAAGSAATVLLSDAVLAKPTAADVDFSADVTTSDATSGHHGLLPKLAGGSAKFLREDGSWQLVGASSTTVFRGCRVSRGANQLIGSGTYNPLNLDTEDFDTDTFHFTSSSNLTGTVAKTSGSAAIVGTGTSFTTELSVNQVISIPGTTTEWGVVKTITDNTHLTLWKNMANTASGQTATRRNEAIAIPVGLGGYYLCIGGTLFAANATGVRRVTFAVNEPLGSTNGPSLPPRGLFGIPGVSGIGVNVVTSTMMLLSEGDFVTLVAYQTSGGNLNVGDSADNVFTTHLSVTRLG